MDMFTSASTTWPSASAPGSERLPEAYAWVPSFPRKALDTDMKLACLRISVAVLEDLFVFFQCQLVPQEAKKCMVFGKCHNGHNNLISPGRVHRRCLASHSSMLSSAGSPSLNYRSRCGRQWCWPSVSHFDECKSPLIFVRRRARFSFPIRYLVLHWHRNLAISLRHNSGRNVLAWSFSTFSAVVPSSVRSVARERSCSTGMTRITGNTARHWLVALQEDPIVFDGLSRQLIAPGDVPDYRLQNDTH